MGENFIEYHFDSVQTFYAELDDLLLTTLSPITDGEIEQKITHYIRFTTRYSNEFISTTHQIAQVAYKLIDSTLYLDHSTLILSHILSHHALSNNASEDELPLSYSILYYAGKEDSRWMTYIATKACHLHQNRLFRKILSELQSFTGGYKLMSISFKLLFEMGKVASLNEADLDAISLETLDFFFNLIESTADDSEERFNYEIIHFILILNEQYMMTQTLSNKVLDAISKRIGLSDTLAQNLLFMLNRSEDDCLQLLILKLLYGIFTRSDICDFFYTNDLCVLVDIILRSLCELDDEASMLRNSYLRVLKPLLIYTPLRQSLYKKHEIHQILCSLITPCLNRPVKNSTKKLVKEILEDWWQVICNKPVAPLLGVHVKHAILQSGSAQGENAIIMSAPPSIVSSDTEQEEPEEGNDDKDVVVNNNDTILCI